MMEARITSTLVSDIPIGTKIALNMKIYSDYNKSDSHEGIASYVVFGCSMPSSLTFESPSDVSLDLNNISFEVDLNTHEVTECLDLTFTIEETTTA